eukprot:m.24487 g.24487  ORF g.24487 m.24487 type:complete len:424 (-) comp8709_c0_seq1:35-1306(-)
MAVVNGCPAFEDGCPFPKALQTINTAGCPAFKDHCPFDTVKQTKDIQSILETMPASHSSSESTSGKAVQTFFSMLHKFSAELSKLKGPCPVFSTGCPFRTTCVSGRLLLSELDAAQWGVSVFDASQAHRLSLYLKTYTKEVHTAAENVPFIHDFAAGKLKRDEYLQLISSLFYVYTTLEKALEDHAFHPSLRTLHFPAELFRTASLEADLVYFCGEDWASSLPPSPCTKDYVAQIESLARDHPALLLAHAYTRYLGDLSGGQVLSKILTRVFDLPESGEGAAFYRFDNIRNAKEFKQQYRQRLDALSLPPPLASAVATEAKRAFLLNIRIFQEIGRTPILPLACALAAEPSSEPPTEAAAAAATCPFAGGATGEIEPTCPFPFILLHSPLEGIRTHPLKTALLVLCVAMAVLQPFFFAFFRSS